MRRNFLRRARAVFPVALPWADAVDARTERPALPVPIPANRRRHVPENQRAATHPQSFKIDAVRAVMPLNIPAQVNGAR